MRSHRDPKSILAISPAHLPVALRLLLFLLVLLLVWVPLALPIRAWFGADPNQVSLLTMPLLYLEFVILVRVWDQKVYGQSGTLQRYGLRFNLASAMLLLQGLGVSLLVLGALFGTETALGWVSWQSPVLPVWRLCRDAAAIGLAVGFAEELLFRGWLLDELQRDYAVPKTIWLSAGLFAALHFIKPIPAILATLPQLAGLLLLGLILAWAKYTPGLLPVLQPQKPYGTLALPIGLHAGLVGGYYLINVGQWVDYSDQIPTWVTGIDANPLAGLAGLLGLLVLAIAIRRRTQLPPAVTPTGLPAEDSTETDPFQQGER